MLVVVVETEMPFEPTKLKVLDELESLLMVVEVMVVEARKSEVARVEAEPRLSEDDEKVSVADVVVVETEMNRFPEVTL